jgi:hypothetical protein
MLTQQRKQAVFDRDKKCLKCGTAENLTIDHILPLSRGGNDDMTNLQALCRTCNWRKGFFRQLSLVERISIWLHCDELVERTRNEFKSIVSLIQSETAKQSKVLADLSSKVNSVPSLQGKADTALSLVHQQTSRTTSIEARLHLLEQHLKLEYFDEPQEVERTVKETIQVRGYRKKT